LARQDLKIELLYLSKVMLKVPTCNKFVNGFVSCRKFYSMLCIYLGKSAASMILCRPATIEDGDTGAHRLGERGFEKLLAMNLLWQSVVTK